MAIFSADFGSVEAMKWLTPIYLIAFAVLAIPLQGQDSEPAPEDRLRPPAAQVIRAYQDQIFVPKVVRSHTRYLDLANYPLTMRPWAVKVLSGHLQHLSRSATITQPYIVPDTSLSLVRVNLKDYGIDPKVWDKLIEIDTVYHSQREEYYDWPDPAKADPKLFKVIGGDKCYPDEKGNYYVAKKYKRSGQLPATWIGDDAAATAVEGLERETGSKIPILRANQFFRNSAAQADRVPGYYQFLGVTSRADWEHLIGYKANSGQIIRAAVASSGVTNDARAYVRKPAANGPYWLSIDFKKGIGKQNPLAIVGQPIEDAGEAFEAIGYLPNGFLAFGLFNDKGQLVDSAPDFIAGNGQASRNDYRVHVGVSCIHCHKEGGLRPLDDWFRNLYQDAGQLRKTHVLRDFRDEYLTPLPLEQDRIRYTEAVKAATGWEVAEYAKKYGELFAWDEDLLIDVAQAEREFGVPRKVIAQSLARAISQGQENTVLEALLLEGPRARGIPVRQFEDQYGAMQNYLQRYYP